MAAVRQEHPETREDEIVEKGGICFAYRSRVDEEEAGGLEDVQRFYRLMRL
jgi:hypothetical protein